MDLSTATSVLEALLAIMGLWFLLFWLYRDYRIDYFRNRVFDLRSELFDIGARGELSFDSPAYQYLRTTMNGAIRFAERIGIISFALMRWGLRDVIRSGESEATRWEAALAQLQPDTKAELIALRAALHYEVTKQLMLSSPLLTATLLPLLGAWVVKRVSGRVAWRVAQGTYHACSRAANRSFLRVFDAVAYEVGLAA